MIGFRVPDNRAFFDSAAVMSRVAPAKRKVLSKGGAYIRQTARGSIRKGKKPSRPGQPPRNQSGILKRFLFFAYDFAAESVTVGPAKTNQVFLSDDGKPVSGTVPGILEAGGAITVIESRNPWTGKWNRADLRYKTGKGQGGWERRTRRVPVEARPFMAPALAKNQSKLAAMWRNALN